MYHNKITKVLFIQDDPCKELVYILNWLEQADIHEGILVLDGTKNCDRLMLKKIKDIGISIFEMGNSSLEFSSDNIPTNKLTHDLGVTDGILFGISDLHKNEIYLNTNSTLGNEQENKKFTKLLADLGLKINYRDHSIAIDNGDCIRVKNHLFFGKNTLGNLSLNNTSATTSTQDFTENVIRSSYNVPKSTSMSFFSVVSLYHLDLYFAYGGQNQDGVDQYFVGEVISTDQVYEPMKEELSNFKTNELHKILDRLYREKPYCINTLPLIFVSTPDPADPTRDKVYLYSPLNGIVDYINDKPHYYFPFPVWEPGSPAPDFMANLEHQAQDAYNKMIEIIGEEKRVVKFLVPVNIMNWAGIGGGQSLHCSMIAIGRD